MDLSICIVNYNSRELIVNCIRSIYAKTGKISFEVIVADNNSTDKSCESIEREFPGVKLVINKNNLGFATANNQAINIAVGKFIILLNNDTFLKNDALDKLVSYMQSDPRLGIATCKLLEKDGRIQHNCRAFPRPLDTFFGRASLISRIWPDNPITRKNLMKDWNYDTIREVDWVSGAALMIRRETLENIGKLDENFFIYWEDTDWCKRAHDSNWKIKYFPSAEIIHFTGQGGGKRSLQLKLYTIYQMHRSAYYYFRKHYYKRAWHPMAILLLFGMILLTIFKGSFEIMRYSVLALKGA